MVSFVNLLCLLSTYLIESWISPACSYEFSVVYVQRGKSEYLLYCKTYEVHIFRNKQKNKNENP